MHGLMPAFGGLLMWNGKAYQSEERTGTRNLIAAAAADPWGRNLVFFGNWVFRCLDGLEPNKKYREIILGWFNFAESKSCFFLQISFLCVNQSSVA